MASTSDLPSRQSDPISAKTITWVNTTYFAEGLPYMLVRVISTVFFTQCGVKESYLGALNLLGLPWNMKFLWAPLLDGWWTKKRWQVFIQLLIGVLTCAIGGLAYLAAGAADPTPYLTTIAGAFVVMAYLSATNDIAIDGYYLEAIRSRADQALLSGHRVLAYRLAVIFARSGLVALVAAALPHVPGRSIYIAWSIGFGAAGVLMIALALLHKLLLAELGNAISDNERLESHISRAYRVFTRSFATYLQQPQVALVLTFIVVYKMGDEILFSMVTPFMLRELKVTLEQYAWIGGIVGAVGAIVGAMAGGYWIKRVGLRRALWPLTLIMNLNIWLYVWLSIERPDPATTWGISVIAAIHGVEQLAAGVGSAALLVYLLTTCSREYKATHYAVGSAIMSIPGTLIGGSAGWLVQEYGYTNLYILAFIAAIPGMALIPFVPIRPEDAA